MQDAPRILLLEADAAIASHLVIHLEKAGADVITADHALQAMQRLAQFTFSAAILDYWDGADDRSKIAERLLQLCVPVVVHAHVAPPPSWCAPHFADPDAIVAAIMRAVQAPRTP